MIQGFNQYVQLYIHECPTSKNNLMRSQARIRPLKHFH